MRIPSAFLALSLLANLALAWLLFAPGPSAPTAPSPATRAAAASPSLTTTPTLAVKNPVTMRDRLLALGLPVDAVHIAVRAHLEAPRLARLRELRATTTALPWWHGITGVRFTPEQERELSTLRRTEREELTRLFGPAATITAAETEPYLFLPPDKAARLAALERDYRELRDQLAESALSDPAGVDERKRLLAADRERDVAALLEADERTALDLRMSDTARQLSLRFAYFEGTEAEHRALFDLQKSFEVKFPPTTNGPRISFSSSAFSLAMSQLTADQQTALGSERYAAWQLTQRPDYRTLVDLQHRYAITPATFSAVSQLPFDVAPAANRIYDDPSLTSVQKTAALQALAAQTRAQIQTTLGSAAGDAYLSSAGSQWLTHLDRGGAFIFGPGGIERVKSPSR